MINPDTLNALFDEVLALRRANGILRDRLHMTKRKAREDKVKLRNTVARLQQAVNYWVSMAYHRD